MILQLMLATSLALFPALADEEAGVTTDAEMTPETSLDVDAAVGPYAFVQNFRLINVTSRGSLATATVEFNRPASGTARFEFIRGQACLESFPAQCYGTLVRLDDSAPSGLRVRTQLQFNLAARFGAPTGVIVTFHGPQGRRFRVRY